MFKLLLATFIFTTLLAIAFLNSRFRERTVFLKRLQKIVMSQAAQNKLEEDELSKPFGERVIRPLLVKISRVLDRVIPVKSRVKLQRELQFAGEPWNLQPHEFQAMQYGMIFFLTLGGWFLTLSMGKTVVVQLFMAFSGGLLGVLMGKFYLTARIKQRQTAIQKELPDVLDLLTVSVDAGLGFDAALMRVVEKFSGELSKELRKTLQEMQMGKTREEALKDLGERTGVEDLLTFISSMIQADQLGVSISKVIRTQAEQVRLKKRQRIEEKAMQAPIKMLFPLVFFIFPSIFIVLLGPAVLRITKIFGGGM
ncbi:MAG TPA: type II secretion system F family protein [Clostridia bacterium]|jgi:tight adherence protein C|nr:type II secretion system F family protein [Clostridia bacterium]